MNPQYPVYIVSKGRAQSRLTSKALEKMEVPYHIVVEPQEFDEYASVIDPAKILVLPFSNLGRGCCPARNWIWEHSIEQGAKRHWIMDDNIRCFYRLNQNLKSYLTSGTGFKVVEDFVDRFKNVGIAGLQYEMFAPRKQKHTNPFILNTRIYSCILLNNTLPHRWRGRYNEDTDLSIRVLKDGWCTMLFYAFLAEKKQTMRYKGGNTDELYKGDGRLLMAQSLQRQHPDIVTVVRKWNRWQHLVDYSSFKTNQLIPVDGFEMPQGVDDYGLQLRTRTG